MSAANHLRKQNPVILRGTPITSSQALKYAWWFESFRKKLSTGVIRQARGTLDFSRIPEEHHPKSLSSAPDVRPENYNTFPYYDLDAAGWRSFRLDNFIGFVEEVKV